MWALLVGNHAVEERGWVAGRGERNRIFNFENKLT